MERRCATFLSLLLLLCFGAGAAYAQRTCSPLVPVNASAPPANLTTPCCDLQTALFAVADPHTAPLSEAPLSQMVYWWGVLVMHDLGLIPEADADWLQPPATPCDVAAAAVPANFSQCPGPPPGTANGATPELDASFLYGSSSATTSILRQHYHGYLEIQPSGELTRTCPGVERYAGPGQSPSQMPCAGDPRAASELQLLALQTLFVQFHNRLCDRIRGWEERLHDDDIFNRVRAIVTGIVQRITLEEWLPVMLGSAAATAVPPYRPPPRGAPRPYVLLEFAAALPPLLASMQSPRVLYSDQNQELSEIPLAAGFYAPSQLHRVLGNEGACTVVTGLLRDPLRRLGPTLPQPLMDASLPARTCTLAAALNLSSFRQLQGALRVGGGGGGGAGAGVGVYEGLAGEAHGPGDADILGPTARALLILQLVNVTRGLAREGQWYESRHYGSLGKRQMDVVRRTRLADLLTESCAFLDSMSMPSEGSAFALWSVSDVKIIEQTNSNLNSANLGVTWFIAALIAVIAIILVAFVIYGLVRYRG